MAVSLNVSKPRFASNGTSADTLSGMSSSMRAASHANKTKAVRSNRPTWPRFHKVRIPAFGYPSLRVASHAQKLVVSAPKNKFTMSIRFLKTVVGLAYRRSKRRHWQTEVRRYMLLRDQTKLSCNEFFHEVIYSPSTRLSHHF